MYGDTMKYLVLGSNSFGGSCFIKELLTREIPVIGISRSQNPEEILLSYANHPNAKAFTFYAYDLNHNLEDIKRLINKENPNYIIDFAAQSMVAESWNYPDQWYATNIVSKAKLHNFLRNCDFLEKYIRISTPEVYGHCSEKITEGQSFNPTTPYAVSQAAIDMSLLVFYKQFQFPVIFTRYANFYGPHQQLYRIIPKTIICGLLGEKLPLHGKGVSRRAFIYGDDVASAIMSAITHGELGESYHFSNNDCISIAELIQKIAKMLNVQFTNMVEMSSERPGKDFQYFMDTKKSEQKLGWRPKINLDVGLQNTIDWVSRNKETIKKLPLFYQHKP